MSEPRVDYDALKRQIVSTNARLIDSTFDAYTKGQVSRKQEFVDQWKTAFDRISDPDALRDGSDGMLLNGILMEAILRGEVRSDFADWVFPGERARKLARALEELVRIGGVVPRYNRRDMPTAIAAYRVKRPKMEGSFSARLSASLSGDAADMVEDWVLGRGDWAPYEARGDRTRSVFSDIKKDEGQPTLQQQIAALEQEQNEAASRKDYARAAELQAQIEALKAQAAQQQVPDLNTQIAELERQQEQAAASRDYAHAADLGRQIEELRAQLEELQPKVAELRTIPLAQSVRQPANQIVVTPTETIVNGPATGILHATLEARRQEVVDILSTKKFRLDQTRTSFLQQIYAAADAAAVENLRQRVVAMP